MTGRLIKYEIRSSIKLMAVIWAALIAASLLFSVSSNLLRRTFEGASQGANTLVSIVGTITGFMYISIFIALVAATVIIVILRFYKGLLGDEGYLMHTLPVKPWQLITSKGLVAAGVVLLSIIVAMVSLAILAGLSSLSVIPDIFSGIAKAWKEDPRYILIIVEVLVIMVLSLLKSIYQVYASLAIGQLAGKHRILLSLASYIGLSTAVTVFFIILGMIAGSFDMVDLLSSWDGSAGNMFGLSQFVIAVMFGLTAIQLVAFHIITERILSLKLNLQ